MGFSITACVITGIMFICYCVAVGEFANTLRCRRTYEYYRYYPYCYSSSRRFTARNGAGLGSCLLIFSIVEFFVALASSIYCCMGICCNTTAGAVGTVSISYALFVFVCSNLDITCKTGYIIFPHPHSGKFKLKIVLILFWSEPWSRGKTIVYSYKFNQKLITYLHLFHMQSWVSVVIIIIIIICFIQLILKFRFDFKFLGFSSVFSIFFFFF